MLTDLAIRDLGAIGSSAVEFSPGLTVLTGETGAGKTMLVTGLRLLAGGRADAGRVREGAAKAVVEGHIALTGLDGPVAESVRAAVADCGGELDENGEALLVRQVSAKGRSRAWVGGRATPAAALAGIAGEVIAIHGQNDQLRLLGAGEQRAALDRMGAAAHHRLLAAVGERHGRWRELAKDLAERTERRRELAMRADQLRFAIGEIDAVDPEPGEDAELARTIRRLQDVDGLREAALGALGAIDGDPAADAAGAADLLGRAGSLLGAVEDPELAELAERLGTLTSVLADVSADLGRFAEALPAEAGDLDGLLSRQAELRTLTRKYAPDLAGVLAWRDKAVRTLDGLDVSEDALERLAGEVAAAEADYDAAAAKLTASRRRLAGRLAEAVTAELAGLAMPEARFAVDLADSGGRAAHGRDEVVFGLAGHAGGGARPLATSASGGELSRVMLALEVVLAAGDTGRTLIFDEVDAGVGGRAAVEIGRRLARLAAGNQVIVVTHLPQVAAYADTHLHVAKGSGAGAASSAVAELDRGARIAELARMLAGLDDTASGRAHAADLLERAEADRRADAAG